MRHSVCRLLFCSVGIHQHGWVEREGFAGNRCPACGYEEAFKVTPPPKQKVAPLVGSVLSLLLLTSCGTPLTLSTGYTAKDGARYDVAATFTLPSKTLHDK